MLSTERLLTQVAKLIEEGEAIVCSPIDPNPGVIGVRKVDLQAFQKWHTSCNNLTSKLGAFGEPYSKAIASQTKGLHSSAKVILGTIESLQEAIRDGLLVEVEDLILADAFGSLLEQAEHLLTRTSRWNPRASGPRRASKGMVQSI